MKKFLLLTMVLLTGCGMSYADCSYSCVEPYDMSNKFMKVLNAVSGVNYVTEKKLETVIKKEFFKIGSSDNVKVEFESYSPKDLKNGIFKSMHVQGSDVLVNDIHISELDLKTLCNFNYIKLSNDEIVVVEDFPMAFNMKLTPDDLNRTMLHSRYQKVIEKLNSVMEKYAKGLKIGSTKVAIRNDKFYYIIGFKVPMVRSEQKIVAQADLSIKNGKIDFTNMQLASGNIRIDLNKLDYLLNYLNPLDFSVNIFKNKNAKVNVKNLYVRDNVVYTNGIITIKKD